MIAPIDRWKEYCALQIKPTQFDHYNIEKIVKRNEKQIEKSQYFHVPEGYDVFHDDSSSIEEDELEVYERKIKKAAMKVRKGFRKIGLEKNLLNFKNYVSFVDNAVELSRAYWMHNLFVNADYDDKREFVCLDCYFPSGQVSTPVFYTVKGDIYLYPEIKKSIYSFVVNAIRRGIKTNDDKKKAKNILKNLTTEGSVNGKQIAYKSDVKLIREVLSIY